MRTPAEKYDGLALNYPGTPFSSDMKSVYVLRTSVDDVGSYEIPFGGTSSAGVANIEGNRLWNEPFNGNGVTRSDDHFAPEWELMGGDLATGDAIIRIDEKGREYPYLTYVNDVGWFPPKKDK